MNRFRYEVFKRAGPGYLAIGELIDDEGCPIGRDVGAFEARTCMIDRRGATEAEALANVKAEEPLAWRHAREGGWI